MAERDNSEKYLATYLRDHLASAVAGSELARRMAKRERHNALGDQVNLLLEAIQEDRRTLEQVMDQFDVSKSRLKNSTAWLGEKLSRLKLNGNVVRRSPLSPLVELEGLTMGATGKRNLWETLQVSPWSREFPQIDFEEMIGRADDQIELLREVHRIVAKTVFSAPASESETRSRSATRPSVGREAG